MPPVSAIAMAAQTIWRPSVMSPACRSSVVTNSTPMTTANTSAFARKKDGVGGGVSAAAGPRAR